LIARLAELVREQPDATLAELRDKLGIQCSLSAIWRGLRQLGLSFKKRPSTPAQPCVAAAGGAGTT
jgi:transposase